MKRGNFKFTAIGEVLRVHEVENGSLSASFPKDYNDPSYKVEVF